MYNMANLQQKGAVNAHPKEGIALPAHDEAFVAPSRVVPEC